MDSNESEERTLKVSFNKSGGTSSKNGVTTRITLPTSWVKKLGLTEENREVIVLLEKDKITIKPKDIKKQRRCNYKLGI